jgi:hypothetical protein
MTLATNFAMAQNTQINNNAEQLVAGTLNNRINTANTVTIAQYGQLKPLIEAEMTRLANEDPNGYGGMYEDGYYSQAVQNIYDASDANKALFNFNGKDELSLIKNNYYAFENDAFITAAGDNNDYYGGNEDNASLLLQGPGTYNAVEIGSGADYDEYYMGGEDMYATFASSQLYNAAALFQEAGKSTAELTQWLNGLDITNLTGYQLEQLAQQETGLNLHQDKVGYRFMTFDNNDWHENGLYSINQKLGDQFDIDVPDIGQASRDVLNKVKNNDAAFLAAHPELVAIATRIDELQALAAAGDQGARDALATIETNFLSDESGMGMAMGV